MFKILLSVALFLTVVYAHADCGLSGSIDARIKDCSVSQTTRENVTWKLISQLTTQRDYQPETLPLGPVTYRVWLDTASGLVWSGQLDSPWDHSDQFDTHPYGYAIMLDDNNCSPDPNFNSVQNCTIKSELVCGSSVSQTAKVGISDRTFGLPTIHEFAQAFAHGWNEVISGGSENYWTTSLWTDYSPNYPSTYRKPSDKGIAISYNGAFGYNLKPIFRGVEMDEAPFVRCVGR